MDSSFKARKQLAQELNYTGDPNDSASMNVWLHKQVLIKDSGKRRQSSTGTACLILQTGVDVRSRVRRRQIRVAGFRFRRDRSADQSRQHNADKIRNQTYEHH
jgi:hypothetical protein